MNSSSFAMIVPPFSSSAEVRLQRGRVHGDEHVRLVARRQDVARGELDLERRHAVERSARRPDLGREVRKRRQIVPEHGRRVREAVAGQLHAVAGVTGESDDDSLSFFD